MVANVAGFAASTLTDAGLPRVVLDSAAGWLAAVKAAGLEEQAVAMKLTLAEAAILSGHYERAAGWLADFERQHPSPRSNPVYLRLADKIDNLLRAVDQPDRPDTPFSEILARSLQALAGGGPAFEKVIGQLSTPAASDGFAPGSTWMRRLEDETTRFGFPPRVEGFDQTAAALDAIDQSGSPMFLVHKITESCGELLQTLAPDDRDAHLALAALAARAARKAHNLDLWEEAQSQGWIASVALRRAGALSEASAILKELRENLRSRQLGIRDPRLRAALAMNLPHLAAISAEVLFALGEPALQELFDAIESSKGRVLADLVEQRAGQAAVAGVEAIRGLLRAGGERAAYCTFLVDDLVTYAVLVPRDGPLVGTRLGVGRKALAAAVAELQRLNDGGARPGAPDDWSSLGPLPPDSPWDRPYDEVLRVVHPFAAWWKELLDEGVLRERDVLCLGLDGPLFGLPLQAMDIGGGPLGLRFGCTIVPSASTLLACSQRRQQHDGHRRPAAVVVPLASEDEARAGRNLEALGQHGAVDFLGGPSADVACLQRAELAGTVLHIAAHGLFDAKDPLRRSGLVLARDGAYPPGKDALSGSLLTPNELAQLELGGAHICFRACVSGKTTEVTSREALGMIWAAFQAGATSMMAGQWDVYIPSAADVLDGFYAAAAEGQALVEAYRRALAEVRGRSPNYAHPYHFCGLAFYGYWR
jgi:hypothetical protein